MRKFWETINQKENEKREKDKCYYSQQTYLTITPKVWIAPNLIRCHKTMSIASRSKLLCHLMKKAQG